MTGPDAKAWHRCGYAVVLAGALMISPLPRSDAIVFHPGEGTSVRRTFTKRIDFDIASATVAWDGETIANLFWALPTSVEQHCVVVDTFGTLLPERPRVLTRTFRKLTGSRVVSENPGPGTTRTPTSSNLEGRTLTFTWKDDAGAYDIAPIDVPASPGRLPDLVEDMDLRGFLPPREVDAGDAWQVEVGVMALLLRPGGVELRAAGDDPAEPEEALKLDGTVRAEFIRLDIDQGADFAVIEITANFRMVDDRIPDEARLFPYVDPEVPQSDETAFELRGELIWNQTAGHLRSVELRGEATRTMRSAYRLARGRSESQVTMKGSAEFAAVVAPGRE